jgi:hypothetical protein
VHDVPRPSSLDDVARLALALPGVEEGVRHGHRTWRVDGTAFAWERPFSQADLRRFGEETAPEGPLLALRVADLEEKDEVLATNRAFFTIPHFDGYAAVLVPLRKIGLRALEGALGDAWAACASARRRRDQPMGRAVP